MSTKLDQSPTSAKKSALLAISGGLDSIVLLHLLATEVQCSQEAEHKDQLKTLIHDFIAFNGLGRLELAYIDHSQRDDTKQDIEVIQTLADQFKLTLHVTKLDLPSNCSEQTARDARYQALEQTRSSRKLNSIITAHHADDVLETAIINLTRGTGPKGLSALRHHADGIWRPFLFKFSDRVFVTKKDLLDYAKQNNLKWHEDSTNKSDKYLRNRVRQNISPNSDEEKEELLRLIANQQQANIDIDLLTQRALEYLRKEPQNTYDKRLFLDLSEDIQKQVLHSLINSNGYDVNKASVIRAAEFIKTAGTKKTLQLKGCDIIISTKDSFSILPARQNQP